MNKSKRHAILVLSKKVMSSPVIHIQHYGSPCGTLVLASWRGTLCLCDWSERKISKLEQAFGARCAEVPTAVLRQAVSELDEYFAGSRTSFTVPLQPIGTDFQCQVWQALASIPYGTTMSYAQIARQIHRPQSVRAVAQAIGANPLSLFIPCHRVIGTDGSLTGYAGGIAAKRLLLHIENSNGANAF